MPFSTKQLKTRSSHHFHFGSTECMFWHKHILSDIFSTNMYKMWSPLYLNRFFWAFQPTYSTLICRVPCSFYNNRMRTRTTITNSQYLFSTTKDIALLTFSPDHFTVATCSSQVFTTSSLRKYEGAFASKGLQQLLSSKLGLERYFCKTSHS